MFANSPTTIRTQVDLQGWSIEALSPGTTLITLLEQSDPKGWSNKNSIPQQMTAAVAGVGEFVIKCGGPPLMTRLHLDSPHNRYGIEFSRGVCYGTAKPYWRGKVERLWLAVSDVEGFRETVTKLSLVLLN